MNSKDKKCCQKLLLTTKQEGEEKNEKSDSFIRTIFSCSYLLAYAPTSFPKIINYQGMLTTPGGSPVPNGDYSIRFRIYTASVGGTTLWDKTKSVSVTNGLFNVKLGESTPINLAFNALYWLGIKVGGDAELSPRTQLTSVGYAYRSLVADTAYVAAPGSDMDARYVNVAGPDSISGTYGGDMFRVYNYGSGNGIHIKARGGTSADGIVIDTAGDNGIEISNIGDYGIEIDDTHDDAIHITDAGDYGIYIYNSVDDGIYMSSPGDYGISIWNSVDDGIYMSSPGDYGMYIYNSANDGIYMYRPGGEGVLVYNAQGKAAFNADRPDTFGLYIYRAGREGVYIDSTYLDGIYMNDCGDDGVQIDWADDDGIHVANAGDDGIYVANAGDDGIYVANAGFYGINAKGNYGNSMKSNSPSYRALYVRSYGASDTNPGLYVYGKFLATGSKSTVVNTSQGTEALYSVEAPDVEFMASGSASLVNGQAQITLERLFQEAISFDIPLKIILTPKGGWSGLYVSEQSQTGFAVLTGAGEQNIDFDWMAIGRRKGYEQRPEVQVADIEQMEALDQEEFEPEDVYYPNIEPPPEEEIEKEEVEEKEREEQ